METRTLRLRSSGVVRAYRAAGSRSSPIRWRERTRTAPNWGQGPPLADRPVGREATGRGTMKPKSAKKMEKCRHCDPKLSSAWFEQT